MLTGGLGASEEVGRGALQMGASSRLVAGLKGDYANRKRSWEGETETTGRSRVLFISQPWLSHSITSAMFYSQLTGTLALLPCPDPSSLPPPPTHPHTADSTLAPVLSLGKGFSLRLPTLHWKLHDSVVNKVEAL